MKRGVAHAPDGCRCRPAEPRFVRIRKLVQAIKDGVAALSIKDDPVEPRSPEGGAPVATNAPEMPELLHPRMADVYREKVRNLCLALESEESRAGARGAI